MNKEIISNKQAVSLVLLFILGSTLIVGTSGAAKKDTWIAVILALLLSIPIILVYCNIISIFPGKDIFDISTIIFGKFFGKIITILYIWFALHLGSLVLYNFNEFINIIALPKTPKLVPSFFFIALCAWGVKEGIEVLGRWSELFVIFLVFVLFLESLLSIPNFKLYNILPILEEGIKPIMTGAFSIFAFPFAETVVFIMVFSSLKNEKSPFKAYIIGLLISGMFLVTISARNTLVLGSYILSLNYFPSYVTASRINIRGFIQRLEALVSISFLIAGFIKISICLLGASKGISKLFNFNDYRFLVIPCALIILNLSFIDYRDSMELSKWANDTYPYYAFIFQVVLPIIIFFGIKLKMHKKATSNTIDNR